jgi:chromosome segregation ATPase
MGIFDGINGKNIELKVSEYSELYGEVLLGVHREVKSLQSKVQHLSTLVESNDGPASADVTVGARVQILQTKLRVAENLINQINANHDRELPALQADISAQDSQLRLLKSEVAAEFGSIRSQFVEIERRADDLATVVGRQGGDLRSLRAGLDNLAPRVETTEQIQESAGTRIQALEAAGEVLSRKQNATRKRLRMIVLVGAGSSAVLFVLVGVMLWARFAS